MRKNDVTFESGMINILNSANSALVIAQTPVDFSGYSKLNFLVKPLSQVSVTGATARKFGFHTKKELNYIQYGTSTDEFRWTSLEENIFSVNIAGIEGVRYPYCGGFSGYIYRIWLS